MAETIFSKIILRNDTAANWTTANPVLLKGEVGVEIDTRKFKFGDGSSSWSALQYAGVGQDELDNLIKNWVEGNLLDENKIIKDEYLPEAKTIKLYEVSKNSFETSDADAIANYLTTGNITPSVNDIAVVTTVIDTVEHNKSSYMYDGSAWIALNGAVDAEKVILRSNITLAGDYTQVGNLTKTKTGTATFETKGKSVAAALTEIFSKRLQPSITGNPSVSGFALTGAGAVEAGTILESVTAGTAKLNAGSYTYGPATGIVASSYKIDRVATPAAYSKESISTSASYTDTNNGDGFQIGDQGESDVLSSLAYKCTIDYAQGAIAKDNLGDPSNPTIRIAAGSKSQTTSAYTPFRNFWYGATTTKPTLNSAYVRDSLTAAGAYAAQTFTLNVPSGAVRVAIACLATKTGVTKVVNESIGNVDVTDTFTKKENISVFGANGYTAVNYNVWVYEPDVAYENAAVLKVTLG